MASSCSIPKPRICSEHVQVMNRILYTIDNFRKPHSHPSHPDSVFPAVYRHKACPGEKRILADYTAVWNKKQKKC